MKEETGRREEEEERRFFLFVTLLPLLSLSHTHRILPVSLTHTPHAPESPALPACSLIRGATSKTCLRPSSAWPPMAGAGAGG